MTKDEALTLEALKYASSKGYGSIVREMNTAPFIIRCDEALAQPEQEPKTYALLYPQADYVATPDERLWVGLTDEEIKGCLGPEAVRIPPGWRQITQAIEAKLKEKNK